MKKWWLVGPLVGIVFGVLWVWPVKDAPQEPVLASEINLCNGQTIEEITVLLGPPSGRIQCDEDEFYFYNSERLTFHDGGLANLNPELEQKLLAEVARRRHHDELKKHLLTKWGLALQEKYEASELANKSWFDFSDKAYRAFCVPDQITVVAFYAGWNESSLSDLARINEWVAQESGVTLRSVSISSQNDPLVAQCELKGVPCFKVLGRNGRVVGLPCDDLEAVIQRVQRAKHGFFENIKASIVGSEDVIHKSLMAPGSVTVVCFYAKWCGACVQYKPILDDLIRAHEGVVLRRVDIIKWESSVATRYGISQVPAVRVFDCKGRLIGGTVIQPRQVEKNIQRALKTRNP